MRYLPRAEVQSMRLSVTLRVSLACAALVCAASGPVRGQTGTQAFQRGEELYRQDKLLEAEKHYRTALESLPERDQAASYDRLLAIYIRLGRLDRALLYGKRYETWLRAYAQPERLRQLHFEM